MNNTQLIIPKKCKVGFNLRSDTYTGKLGYVIFHDGKVWRKESSWENWRQKPGEKVNRSPYAADKTSVYGNEVAPLEFDNIPTSGFVLNKKVGGNTWSWNTRATYCRVYDPRGFEFEITVPNLLFILQETNSIKGKGLEGEFVYSWDGKDLVLLPCASADYISSTKFTDLQNEKVGAKQLILGATYLTNKEKEVVYLGKMMYFDRDNWRTDLISKGKTCHVFLDSSGKYLGLASGVTDKIKRCINSLPAENFAQSIIDFENSIYANEFVELVKTERATVADLVVNDYGRVISKVFLCDNEYKVITIHKATNLNFSEPKYYVYYYGNFIDPKSMLVKYNHGYWLGKNNYYDRTLYSSLEELLEKNNIYKTGLLTKSGKIIPNTLNIT